MYPPHVSNSRPIGEVLACNLVLACKSISKDRLVTDEDVKSVKLEIEIMTRLLGHPNVVDLKDVYEEEGYVHLVTELCEGGELFHQLDSCQVPRMEFWFCQGIDKRNAPY
ncbi:hypothetical protein L1987_42574 [Smallanthus sonchifolius]|uniref:Uncharacterized protein n=1 Tax=Smallanthus sonchifolius TaxID=185202 RepID=A0ACB9GK75_9ASTR|nr:hypothetical protein L1987_42574 [Smallanthus sonchifolius]